MGRAASSRKMLRMQTCVMEGAGPSEVKVSEIEPWHITLYVCVVKLFNSPTCSFLSSKTVRKCFYL